MHLNRTYLFTKKCLLLSADTSKKVDETDRSRAKGSHLISTDILRVRRVKRARVLCRMAFPVRLFTRDQDVTFQWKRAFHIHFLARAWVLFVSPNEKITAAFLIKLIGTRVIMLARSPKHCRFRSRTFGKMELLRGIAVQ